VTFWGFGVLELGSLMVWLKFCRFAVVGVGHLSEILNFVIQSENNMKVRKVKLKFYLPTTKRNLLEEKGRKSHLLM
jgi:hypothetical protein